MAYSDEDYFLKQTTRDELDNLLKDSDGTVNNDRLTQAIEAADSTINGYIKKAVKTIPIPDAKVPANIRLYSYYIATYSLHEKIQYEDIPTRIKDNYDVAVNFLKDVSRGLADLDITEETEGEDLSSGIDYTGEPPIFGSNSF